MIILDVVQGSPGWLAARAGIPTASNFDKIVMARGERSAQAQKYLYQLAGERLLGAPSETYQNGAMLRGKELEPLARAAYEFISDNPVTEIGFCLDDIKRYGCSPDGLVGVDGLIEIKCPSLSVHVEYLDKGGLPIAYFQQVQGQMLVTGREWCDFFSYYPGLPPLLIRAERDEKFLKLLEKELVVFCEKLDALTKRLRRGNEI